MTELISTTDLANELGCNSATVRRAAVAHGIGQQVGRGYVFTRAEAKKLAKLVRPGKRGNPNLGKNFEHQYRGGRPPATKKVEEK